MTAAQRLATEGIEVAVIDARFCKPLDGEMLAHVLIPAHPVITLEDHSLQNGFGSAVLEYAAVHQLPTEHVTRLGMPDRLIAHATRKEQLTEVGLDPLGIAQSVRDAIRAATASAALVDMES
jgi:1-deoxy-D-xylulose-5-phosphate synthase